jgi:hypothetical protein
MTRAFYNSLFRDLFPAQWRAFVESRTVERGRPLVEVFAESEEEVVQVMNDAPPIGEFCELMESYYFPMPPFWEDSEDMYPDDEEMDHFLFQEIPVNPLFEAYDMEDPHTAWPVFQALMALNGTVGMGHDRQTCGDGCELRALFALACNEYTSINPHALRRLCRREKTPLKHLYTSLEVMEKQTGNIWFDMDYEMYSGTNIGWSLENVRMLKGLWEKALVVVDSLHELNNWFRKDIRRIREASTLWRKAAML